MRPVTRFLTRHPRLQGYMRKILMPLGVEFYMDMDDRRVLETIILPYFAGQAQFSRVLFIGCDWYTRGYRKFFPGPSYWTLDFAPAQRKYGSVRHIVDGAEHVANHFQPGSLDLIICNGVYGFGLDDPGAFDAAIDGCHSCLRDGGVFLLGWDDNPARTPFPLADSRALGRFGPFVMPPLGTHRYLTANAGRHTFDFFIKQSPASR